MTKKKIWVLVAFWVVIALLVITGFILWQTVWKDEKYTSDAYVEGNQVVVTPLRDGFITNIYSDDTFLALEGQMLIQLDETDSRLLFDQTKENLAQVIRSLCQTYHQVFAYESEIKVWQAEVIKTRQDLEHREAVISTGAISLEDLEHAQAAYKASFYNLKKTENLYQKERSLIVGKSIQNNPLVLKAIDQLAYAYVQLKRCKIYSPVKGLVAQRKAQVGMWVKSGEPLLNVIPLNQIWVNTNFKETQMRHMKIGQSVKMSSDLYGKDVVYHGKIIGLPGGAGNAFSILPPQNLSGNWIKIVQRLPVRVSLDPDEIQAHPLRIGLSMLATVDIEGDHGSYVPDSAFGSPHYQTEIFQSEEEGIESIVDKVFCQNIDSNLQAYTNRPYE